MGIEPTSDALPNGTCVGGDNNGTATVNHQHHLRPLTNHSSAHPEVHWPLGFVFFRGLFFEHSFDSTDPNKHQRTRRLARVALRNALEQLPETLTSAQDRLAPPRPRCGDSSIKSERPRSPGSELLPSGTGFVQESLSVLWTSSLQGQENREFQHRS